MFHKGFFSPAKSDMINHAFNFPRIGLTILRTLATEVWPAQLPSSVFKRVIILLYPIHNQVRFVFTCTCICIVLRTFSIVIFSYPVYTLYVIVHLVSLQFCVYILFIQCITPLFKICVSISFQNARNITTSLLT